MRTENEIETLSLTEKQRLWVELRAVTANSRDYPTAKALILFITETDDWEEPVQGEVVAKADCQIDGQRLAKGATARIYEWQFKALRRFLTTPEELAKKTGKAAAVLLFALLLGLGWSSQAQTQATLVGGPGQFQVYSIAGLAGTNGNVLAAPSNSMIAPAITFTTNVSPNWTVVNGTPTNAPQTNITSVTNIPGVISLVNWDQAQLSMGFSSSAGSTGSGTNATFWWDTSADGLNWQTNALIVSLPANAATPVGTNYFFSPGPNPLPAYLRLDEVIVPATMLWISNVWVEVALKAKRTGP